MIDSISHFLIKNTNLLIAVLAVVFILYLLVSLISKLHRLKNRPMAEMSKKTLTNTQANVTTIITSQDIRAIAGEDVMVTQLDLARAYIELGKNNLAKKILNHVINHGNIENKKAAEQLIANL